MRSTNRILVAALVLAVAVGCTKRAAVPLLPGPENLPPDDVCATVQGTCKWPGAKPKLEKLPVASNPECAAHYQGVAAYQEDALVDDKGGLANVFVYVKSGLDAKWKFMTPKEVVEIANEKCVYTPRVIGAMQGQTVKFVDKDSFQHNIHSFVVPGKGDDFNQSLNGTGMSFTAQFNAPQVMVQLKCDLHSWMTGWVGVLEHPYFAISKPDGSWSFARKLPEGTYVIAAWHERDRQEKSVTVTVKKGETVTVPEFDFP